MYVMTLPERATERTRFILGVAEFASVVVEIGVGVGRRLTGGTEIVSRAVIRGLRNSTGVILERMSSDRFPSVNPRASTV